MKLILISIFAFLTLNTTQQAERLVTRDAYVRFFSSTPIENIEGVTKQASSVIDTKTGAVAFKIPMKSFFFEKALMQEHFNENYVESDKFPNASLKATIEGWDNFYANGLVDFNTKVVGEITIHGVTKPLNVPVTLKRDGNNIVLNSVFEVLPADFDIAIPSTVRKNIAETIEVTVQARY